MTRLWILEMTQKMHEDHQRRIEEMKATVQHRHEREAPYSRDRSKERDTRYRSVEAQNRMLIDRLGRAMSSAHIDNSPPHDRVSVSLGEVYKRKQLRSITIENRRLLGRIQEAKPVYDRTAWEAEHKYRERLLRVMTGFPDIMPRERLRQRTSSRQSAVLPKRSSTESDSPSPASPLPAIEQLEKHSHIRRPLYKSNDNLTVSRDPAGQTTRVVNRSNEWPMAVHGLWEPITD